MKFQSDLLKEKFLLSIDCKSAKYVIEKDVENIASKHIFARWQAILSVFYFHIEYIKGSQNTIPISLPVINGSLKIVRKMCNIIQTFYAMRNPSL